MSSRSAPLSGSPRYVPEDSLKSPRFTGPSTFARLPFVRTLEDVDPLLLNLVPVMRNLSDPRTQLAQTVRALGRAARVVAPAAETQADLFRSLDTTFAALARVAGPIQQTIEGGPPALAAATRDLPVTRPFLANTQGLFHDLRPGVRALRTAAPTLAGALEVGTPVLRRSIQLSARLEPAFRSLQRLATHEPPRPDRVRESSS